MECTLHYDAIKRPIEPARRGSLFDAGDDVETGRRIHGADGHAEGSPLRACMEDTVTRSVTGTNTSTKRGPLLFAFSPLFFAPTAALSQRRVRLGAESLSTGGSTRRSPDRQHRCHRGLVAGAGRASRSKPQADKHTAQLARPWRCIMSFSTIKIVSPMRWLVQARARVIVC